MKNKDLVQEILSTFSLSFNSFWIFEFIPNSENPCFLAMPKKRFCPEKEAALTDAFLEKMGYSIYFS